MAIIEIWNNINQPMYDHPEYIAYPHPGKQTNAIFIGGNVMSIPQGKVPTDHNESFWKAVNQWMRNKW